MKFEYKILWIDNDLQSYIDNGSVKSIEDFLSEKGFEPIIEQVFDESELDSLIAKHNYDLIVSDYNLNNTTGDLVIKHIREENRSDADILFYTAQTSYKDNPTVAANLAFIERLSFQVGRNNLLDKIEKVIDLTLKKLLELNSTRGLITAATSDLDVEIEEIIGLLVNRRQMHEEDLKKMIEDVVYVPLKNRVDTFWEKYDNFSLCFPRIDAMQKWKMFRTLLKRDQFLPDISNLLKANQSYQSQVIEVRNKFAHAKAVEIDGRVVLKGQYGKEDYQYDLSNCVEIRKNLISHKRTIESIKSVILDS